MAACVVLQGKLLVSSQRADEDVDVFSLNESSSLDDCRGRGSVGTADDEPDPVPADRCAVDTVGRVRAREVRASLEQRELGAGECHLVEAAKRALTVGEDTDANVARSRRM